MKYIYSIDTLDAISMVTKSIVKHLQNNEKVLWLVSGGSGGKVSIEVARNLRNLDLSNLFVTLSDERYGPVGHTDENWQILINGGFEVTGATVYRPLIGVSRDETATQYSEWLTKTIKNTNHIIGIFGVGADGHTAGIKPNSDAINTSKYAIGYTGNDFERITITPTFIRLVDEAAVQVFGEEKHKTIQQLINEKVSITTQPAQILKEIQEVTLYSDYKKEA